MKQYEPTLEIMKMCAKPSYWFAPSDKPEDWERWGSTYSKNRDSDILAISNYETISDDMLERFPDEVTVISSSHWLVGWIDELYIKHYDDNGPTAAHESIMAWKDELENYCVADDEDFSQREYDSTIENIKWIGSVDERQAGEIFTWLWNNGYDSELECCDGTGGYPSEESLDKAKDALFIDVFDRSDIDPVQWIKEFLNIAIDDVRQMRFI